MAAKQAMSDYIIYVDERGFNFVNRAAKQAFMAELSQIIEENNFIIVSVAIDKEKLAKQYCGDGLYGMGTKILPLKKRKAPMITPKPRRRSGTPNPFTSSLDHMRHVLQI